MRQKYLVTLDQGTTSCRAIIFDENGMMKASVSQEFRQVYPQPGWVEHNANEIFNAQLQVLLQVVRQAQISPEDIAAVGIANQRETVVVWDKKTGEPVCNAIVWQCRRTSEYCDQLRESGKEELIYKKTGLKIDAYFSATKLKWILDHIPGVRNRAEKGEILAGTINTWLVWKLTGKQVFSTDVSNASRTMLFNIHVLDWDDDLLELFDIPRCVLPQVVNNAGDFGKIDASFFGAEIPICATAGDQQAALFGQACFQEGDVKNTYGTGSFMLMNTGSVPLPSANGLLTTVAWKIGGFTQYALEGSVFVAGALIQWLRDELGLISTAHECDILAQQVEDSNGAVIVPAFVGLGTPYWDPYARGTIVGLTRGVSKAHLARAALEAIAFQSRDLLECLKQDAPFPVQSIKVDGGASVSDILLQIQADMIRVPVLRPMVIETTARGAAFMAGLGCGLYQSLAEIEAKWQAQALFRPKLDEDINQINYGKWKKAVERAKNWM